MPFPLLNILLQDYGSVFSGICAGLICKAYFNSQLKTKIKEYEDGILRSNIRIFELEAMNEDLLKRLKEMEVYFSKDNISMN